MSTSAAFSQPAGDGDNRRIAERHDFTGSQMKLLIDGLHYVIHLKDMSTTGICGLTDAPLAPGQIVCLLLDKREPVAAQIKWIRKALIGAAFTEPLSSDLVAKLKRNHATKRR